MFRRMSIQRAFLQYNSSSQINRRGWVASCPSRRLFDFRLNSARVEHVPQFAWNAKRKLFGLKRHEDLFSLSIKSKECRLVASGAVERFSTGRFSVLQTDSANEDKAFCNFSHGTGNMRNETDLYEIVKDYGQEMGHLLRKGIMDDEEDCTAENKRRATGEYLRAITLQRMPNLGYTCDNITLKRTRKLYTSRSCIRKTFESKGIEYISKIALENCLDLLEIISWNHEHEIHLYRLTSKLFPWSSEYELEDLPDYESICSCLDAAGELARAAGQRVTNHPSHFVKLAAIKDSIRQSSIKDLELQSQIFDMMGFSPSHWNKINIHVGGVYGNKETTMDRFAESFDSLSDNLKARLTIENDDTPNSYSVDDLLLLHDKTGIPITFDFHHHQFCPGSMSQKDAFEAALSTWPSDVRPVVHWSEVPECPERRRLHAHSHSNFVYGPINLFGHEEDVDVMIESKAREAALLFYRERFGPRYHKSSVVLQ